MGIEHIIYPRPVEEYIYLKKVPTGEKCPECGSNNVSRYPVICSLGAKMVVKCQDCLCALRYETPAPSENWPPYQPVTDGWEASIAG